jgi:hypothetical protein
MVCDTPQPCENWLCGDHVAGDVEGGKCGTGIGKKTTLMRLTHRVPRGCPDGPMFCNHTKQ